MAVNMRICTHIHKMHLFVYVTSSSFRRMEESSWSIQGRKGGNALSRNLCVYDDKRFHAFVSVYLSMYIIRLLCSIPFTTSTCEGIHHPINVNMQCSSNALGCFKPCSLQDSAVEGV